ncbi:MAG: type II toxin-antitoxin system HicA family toxin [Candidatus Nealsonbacteria bacterium]
MKRKYLIKHLIKNRCIFIREGARHSVFFNPLIKKTSTVPRHKEIDDFLAKKICRDLGIESIKKRRK